MTTSAKITIGAPPRSPTPGPWPAAQVFYCQSLRGSFAWGTAPGTAVVTYVSSNVGTAWIGAPVGAQVTVAIGGHFFAGLCISDVDVSGSRGSVRTLEFRDVREFLTWDYIKGYFNQPYRQMVNGVWKKRYEHCFPKDFPNRIKTFTDAPLPGWQIVDLMLGAPTVGTPWKWDFTGNGLFPQGLLNQPLFDLNFVNGARLDAALAAVCEKTGLVLGLNSSPTGLYQLVWMRKGYGLLPVFPDNADERKLGLSLSGNPTNIQVLGDRNRYQVLNLAMEPDWSSAWEPFYEIDVLAQDIFENETDPVSGLAYGEFPNDSEEWAGRNAAKVRALEITVAEYADLRDARWGDGAAFRDYRKYAQRGRMDLPAKLYLETLVFRAFRPAADFITNFAGVNLPLTSVNLVDAMACRVTYDPVTGAMQDEPGEPADGNGVAIIQGYQFGEDLFELVKPERITEAFFTGTRSWAAATFQIDDSGEGERFIIFEQPVFVQDDAHPFFNVVNGVPLLNAGYRLQIPPVQCALTFEAENFSYWLGTWPNVSRDQVEFVSGLCQEWSGTPGRYREVLFADGQTANQQADAIAHSKLLCQYTYLVGGFNLKWNPRDPVTAFGTPLSSVVDRCEIAIGARDGVMEVTDWTTERQRDNVEPERDLDRKTLANSLFPGQADLRKQANDFRRIGAAIKATPRPVFSKFMDFLRGDYGEGAETVFCDTSTPLPAGAVLAGGTPLFKAPTVAAASPASTATGTRVVFPANYDPTQHPVFAGVLVRDQEPAANALVVKKTGDAYALVQGPVAVNAPVGAPGTAGGATAANGAVFNALAAGGKPAVGVALQAITDNSVQLILVRLGAGGGGGTFRGEYDPEESYAVQDITVISAGSNAGSYVCIQPNTGQAPQLPDTGNLYWVSLSGNAPAMGAWMT